MLLADDKGASLIVAVGTHVTLVEFLDKGRHGMASTFLTRLRVGGKLVDAKGVSRLYRARISVPQPGPHARRGPPRARRGALVHGRGARPPPGARRPRRRPVVVHPRSVRLIDFRYHLVSIVSIFMALAVGIVLGAGPLEGELGDTLNKEVAGLRQDKADLNSQLESGRRGDGGAGLLHRRDEPAGPRRAPPGQSGGLGRSSRVRRVRGGVVRRQPGGGRRRGGVDDLRRRRLGLGRRRHHGGPRGGRAARPRRPPTSTSPAPAPSRHETSCWRRCSPSLLSTAPTPSPRRQHKRHSRPSQAPTSSRSTPRASSRRTSSSSCPAW